MIFGIEIEIETRMGIGIDVGSIAMPRWMHFPDWRYWNACGDFPRSGPWCDGTLGDLALAVLLKDVLDFSD